MQSHYVNASHAIYCRSASRIARLAHSMRTPNTRCSHGVREACDSRADTAARGRFDRIIARV
eukprot:235989-Lingulodinium_polyedra.AAC.1